MPKTTSNRSGADRGDGDVVPISSGYEPFADEEATGTTAATTDGDESPGCAVSPSRTATEPITTE
ncbi:hypothetical protein HSRCO_2757 [Halanaeroarchaeum sp. HSR-CO]|uniref:hypothetical protein n=1 Tax=Halanaeroarchaeum sp. HSR-CO TaxID=2866382 RepID=UPI00217EA4DB|nr:hypothetical protein [Halanaeroarchaeum sp. HSR-CO]UWG49013.1 hypothetical protein HSRCO_2757 [Halanaeroarchaeum sp. HSR-CO]